MDGEGTPTTVEQTTSTATPAAKKTPMWAYLVAAGVVVAIILGVMYALEQQGRLSTGLFGGSANGTVAVVNDVEIDAEDLATSINQIGAQAQLQGVDVTSAEVQANIRSQAVDMLVNTELLKQEATGRGIVITDEDVQTRIDQLVAEVGSEEMLSERMMTLGITDEVLRRDVKTELMIQTLLEQEFANADMTVSEDEVLSVYESAGGAAAGLPPLAEVREQVEAQVRANKEQVVVDEFIAGLRAEADIEIL